MIIFDNGCPINIQSYIYLFIYLFIYLREPGGISIFYRITKRSQGRRTWKSNLKRQNFESMIKINTDKILPCSKW